MDAIGKTVKRIEEGPTGEYGSVDDGTVIVHFTDGTALKIEGSSYEGVSQTVTPLDRAEVNALARAAAGRRETERLTRLQRQAWMALSCEERGERKRAREAKIGPFLRAADLEIQGAFHDQLIAANRQWFGDTPERRILLSCKNCGERACPNALVKIIPAQKGIDPHQQYKVQIEFGSLR